jgi:hypothetical protein
VNNKVRISPLSPNMVFEILHRGTFDAIGYIPLGDQNYLLLSELDEGNSTREDNLRLVPSDFRAEVLSSRRSNNTWNSCKYHILNSFDCPGSLASKLEDLLVLMPSHSGTRDDVNDALEALTGLGALYVEEFGQEKEFRDAVRVAFGWELHGANFSGASSKAPSTSKPTKSKLDSQKSVSPVQVSTGVPAVAGALSSVVASTSPKKGMKMQVKKDLIVDSIKKGASVGLADEAGNLILEFVNTTTRGQLEPYMRTPEGVAIVKLVASTLLMHGIEFVSDDKDTQAKVSAGCGLVIEAASRDVLQPRMAELRKVGLNLANVGGRFLTPSDSSLM